MDYESSKPEEQGSTMKDFMTAKEIEDYIGADSEATFEGEIWLSSDGKHTVHVKAITNEGRKAGGEWAVKVYDGIIKKLGTKYDMLEKTKTNGESAKHCLNCGAVMEYKTGLSKTGKKWSGFFCTADKEHPPVWG